MSRPCEIDGCGREHDSHGLCVTHLTRLRKTGVRGGPIAVRPSEPTGYRGRHKMLGRARDHDCELRFDGCRGQAVDWALDWRHVEEVNIRFDEKSGLPYSVGHDDDYVSACRKCHASLDRERRAVRGDAEWRRRRRAEAVLAVQPPRGAPNGVSGVSRDRQAADGHSGGLS
jgi:hypothetical protein